MPDKMPSRNIATNLRGRKKKSRVKCQMPNKSQFLQECRELEGIGQNPGSSEGK